MNELIKQYKDMTSFTKSFDAEKLSIWAAIENNFKNEKVVAVVDWAKNRSQDDADYAQLISNVWHEFSKYNAFGNSDYREFFNWIELVILHEAKKRKNQLIEFKKDKIKNMKDEISKLESELKEPHD